MSGRFRVRSGPHQHARTTLAAILIVVFCLPVLVMVLGSLRTPGLPPASGLELWPRPARWSNYSDVMQAIPILRQFLNSLLVVALAVPLTVLIASWAGFIAVTGERWLRRLVILASLVAFSVPAAALWVPRAVLYEQVGLSDRLLTVIAPALMATSPIFVLLFALTYRRVPRSQYDSAAIEGLSAFRTWWVVAWPNGRPAVFAVSVLAFVFHWSNLIDPLLFLPREETWTLPLGLRTLASLDPTFYPLMLAAAVLITLPAVTALLLIQRALFIQTLGSQNAS